MSGALVLSDGRIVIANAGTGELRWYSPEGAFLRVAGGIGDGPGEFTALSGLILLPDDSVAAFDLRDRDILIFSPEGQFDRSLRIGGAPLGTAPKGVLQDGALVLATGSAFTLSAEGPTRLERLPLEVFRLDGVSEELTPLSTVPGLEMVIGPTGGISRDGAQVIGRGPRPFGRNTFVAAHGSTWVLADNGLAQLEFRELDGSVRQLVRWSVEERAVTPEDIEADRVRRLARQADPATRARIIDAWNSHPPPPERMPLFSYILMDTAGNVWLKEYTPPAEQESNRHQVFSPDGLWLGPVRLPQNLSILSITDRVVVGLATDELGVESIVAHELVKP